MFVDAKYNEHKLGRDARRDDAHAGAEHAGDEKDQADKWIKGHRRQRSDHACESEQDGNHNGQPIKDFDHSGRNEALPLEQITKAEHETSRSPKSPVGLADCTVTLQRSIAAARMVCLTSHVLRPMFLRAMSNAACLMRHVLRRSLGPCFVDGPG